jgi:hypothetical protein
MNPDAIYDPEPEHDHEDKRAAIADQWQWHTRDWQHRDRHAHVLKDMREDQRGDPNNQKQAQLIARKKCNEETRQK